MARLEVQLHISDKIQIINIAYGDDVFPISKTYAPVPGENDILHIKAECKEYSMIFELAFNPKTLLFELLDIKKL